MSRHSARGSAWEAQRDRILTRDEYRCAYCGTHIQGDDATVDHIEPIALTPDKKYTDAELVAACRRCNGLKSDKALRRLPYAHRRWLPNGLPRRARQRT